MQQPLSAAATLVLRDGGAPPTARASVPLGLAHSLIAVGPVERWGAVEGREVRTPAKHIARTAPPGRQRPDQARGRRPRPPGPGRVGAAAAVEGSGTAVAVTGAAGTS